MTTVTVHPSPSNVIDAVTDDPILTDRILRALREHYVVVERFGGTEDIYDRRDERPPRFRCTKPEHDHA